MMSIKAAEDGMKTLIDNALPIAGLFVVVLGIALFLLWKSMNRQLKKVDANLPADGRGVPIDPFEANGQANGE